MIWWGTRQRRLIVQHESIPAKSLNSLYMDNTIFIKNLGEGFETSQNKYKGQCRNNIDNLRSYSLLIHRVFVNTSIIIWKQKCRISLFIWHTNISNMSSSIFLIWSTVKAFVVTPLEMCEILIIMFLRWFLLPNS